MYNTNPAALKYQRRFHFSLTNSLVLSTKRQTSAREPVYSQAFMSEFERLQSLFWHDVGPMRIQ